MSISSSDEKLRVVGWTTQDPCWRVPINTERKTMRCGKRNQEKRNLLNVCPMWHMLPLESMVQLKHDVVKKYLFVFHLHEHCNILAVGGMRLTDNI